MKKYELISDLGENTLGAGLRGKELPESRLGSYRNRSRPKLSFSLKKRWGKKIEGK